jgi:hypothetical protein
MSKQQQQQYRIECPVCRAAGKSELAHYIRNDKGKTVCPTLLEQSCRHCGQKGHTPKYCVVKKNEEKNNRRVSYRSSNVVQAREEVSSANNPFHAFISDDVEEEGEEEGEMREVEVTTKTREELRIMLCELLGVITPMKNVGTTTVKRRMLWSEMEDSEDEE